MKRLHIFIIKSFVGPLLLTFFISMFILMLQFLWKYVDDLVGKGLDVKIIFELLLYVSAGLVPLALPLAILLASIMTFGNLGEHYELTALKSAGISLLRTMSPLIVFIVTICIAAFFFSNNVLPYTNLKTSILLYDIGHQRPELNIKPGAFNNDVEGYTIRAKTKDPKRNMLYGIMVFDHSQMQGNTNITLADSAKMEITSDKHYLILTLYQGESYVELNGEKNKRMKVLPEQRDKFQEKRIVVELLGFKLERTNEQFFKKGYQMLNLGQLQITIDSLNKALKLRGKGSALRFINSNYMKFAAQDSHLIRHFAEPEFVPKTKPKPVKLNTDSMFEKLSDSEKHRILNNASKNARASKQEVIQLKEEIKGTIQWLRRHEIEWHRKFTLSFLCFIFFFIGAPLGSIIRKGGLGMPVVVSIAFFIIYYVISLFGEKLVRESLVHATIGMWLSSFILLPLGAFLTYKASTDSMILSMDAYTNFFKKIARIFTRKKAKL